MERSEGVSVVLNHVIRMIDRRGERMLQSFGHRADPRIRVRPAFITRELVAPFNTRVTRRQGDHRVRIPQAAASARSHSFSASTGCPRRADGQLRSYFGRMRPFGRSWPMSCFSKTDATNDAS